MSDERLTYRFGPLERRGLTGGVRASQAGTLAVAAGLAVLVLDAAPSAPGALLALATFALACAGVLVPVGRRTLDEWLPVVLAFARAPPERTPPRAGDAALRGPTSGDRGWASRPGAARLGRAGAPSAP